MDQSHIDVLRRAAEVLGLFFKDPPENVYTLGQLMEARPLQHQAVMQNMPLLLDVQEDFFKNFTQTIYMSAADINVLLEMADSYMLLAQFAKKCQRFISETYVSGAEMIRGQRANELILVADQLINNANGYKRLIKEGCENIHEIVALGCNLANDVTNLTTSFDRFSMVVDQI